MGAKQRMGDDLLIELWCTVFSIFIFPFPVFGPWFLVPVPCVPFSVLPSPFSLRRCPFSVLRFPVFPFPVPRSPLPVLLVLRFSLFFSFISY